MSETPYPAPLRVSDTRPNGEIVIRGPEPGMIVGTVVGGDRRYSVAETARVMVEAYNAYMAGAASVPVHDTTQATLFDLPAPRPPSAIAEGR